MRVLYVALGGSRRRIVVEESADVLARGGSVTVLVDDASVWRREKFSPGVTVVSAAKLTSTRLPLKIERLVLFRLPRRAFRMIERGPVRQWSRRAAGAYESRIASRLHSSVTMPLYIKISGTGKYDWIVRKVLRDSQFDYVVLADPASILAATRVFGAADDTGPKLCYGLDYLAVAA